MAFGGLGSDEYWAPIKELPLNYDIPRGISLVNKWC